MLAQHTFIVKETDMNIQCDRIIFLTYVNFEERSLRSMEFIRKNKVNSVLHINIVSPRGTLDPVLLIDLKIGRQEHFRREIKNNNIEFIEETIHYPVNCREFNRIYNTLNYLITQKNADAIVVDVSAMPRTIVYEISKLLISLKEDYSSLDLFFLYTPAREYVVRSPGQHLGEVYLYETNLELGMYLDRISNLYRDNKISLYIQMIPNLFITELDKMLYTLQNTVDRVNTMFGSSLKADIMLLVPLLKEKIDLGYNAFRRLPLVTSLEEFFLAPAIHHNIRKFSSIVFSLEDLINKTYLNYLNRLKKFTEMESKHREVLELWLAPMGPRVSMIAAAYTYMYVKRLKEDHPDIMTLRFDILRSRRSNVASLYSIGHRPTVLFKYVG